MNSEILTDYEKTYLACLGIAPGNEHYQLILKSAMYAKIHGNKQNLNKLLDMGYYTQEVKEKLFDL